MCSQIDMPDGTTITGVGELSERGWMVIGAGDIDPAELTDDECLCSVDVEAVLNAAGVQWEDVDHIGFYVVTEPAGVASPEVSP